MKFQEFTAFADKVLESFSRFTDNKSEFQSLTTEYIKTDKELICGITSNDYISSDTLKGISEYTKIAHCKKTSLKDIDLDYEFWDNSLNHIESNFFFYYACYVLHFFSSIRRSRSTLKLVLINYVGRKLPPQDEMFTSDHVNSGVTIYYSKSYAEVYVYRREEMAKVLVHELIHFFHIDSKHIPAQEEFPIMERFCAVKPVNVNEAFTDALACVFNTIMYTILTKAYERNFHKELVSNYMHELSFIKGQARRVLILSKYNTQCTVSNNEQSHAISYYVIKSLILNDVELFLKFLSKSGFILKDHNDFIIMVLCLIDNTNWKSYGKRDFIKIKSSSTMRMSSLDFVNLLPLRKVYKGNMKP